jgi:hypothetical protein
MIYFSKKLENSEYKCISLKKNEENKQLEIVAELSTACGISIDRIDFSLSIDDAKKIVEFLSNYTTNADVLQVATPDAKHLLAAVLSKLDEMTEQSEESAKMFEQHQMVASQLTSEAMAQAYKNVKQWILNGC